MFYKIDSTRATLKEYSWSTPAVLMPVAAAVKLLRIPLPGSTDDPNVESLAPFQLDSADVPADLREKFQPLQEQLHGYGFIEPVYHWISDPYTSTQICTATFRHKSGKAFAKIFYRKWSQPKKTREYLYPFFVTSFTDGTFFVTSAGKPDMLPPPSCSVQRAVGASVPELLKLHIEKLSLDYSSKPIVPVCSQDEMLELVEIYHAAARDFHLNRGVFVPRSETEILEPVAVAATPQTEADLAFAATYQEIENTQNKKAGWTSGILILAVSVALFLGLGFKDMTWQPLILLSGVLLFHELGHLAAMKLFQYKNLRMFFIPFFGAAVTGQNYNVPGWKKAIVSLMGPLPGIVLGAGLGSVALYYHWPAVIEASFMLVAINAFNLLPVLPLDGGWIMHTVLFSRHPILDVGFRIIAAIALLLSGLIGMKFLMYIGIFMLIGLPTSYRVAMIIYRLRKNGVNMAAPDSSRIPIPTARLIFNELKTSLPANTNAKTLSQLTVQVFESLNASPPGWLASLAFVGVHGFSILVALIFAVVLVIARHGPLNEFMAAAIMQPKNSVDSREVLSWKGADADKTAGSPINTIIATFPARSDAETSYNDIKDRLPANATAALFGQTMLVVLPENDDVAREKWFNELNGRCKDISVNSSKFQTSFSLTCIAPNEEVAGQIEKDCEAYFNLNNAMCPIPPWSREQQITDQERLARLTYDAIQEQLAAKYDDPQWKSIVAKYAEAQRRGDAKKVESLNKERRQVLLDLNDKYLKRLRDEGADKWDLEVIDLYTKSPFFAEGDFLFAEDGNDRDYKVDMEKRQKEEKAWSLQFGKKVGQLPLNDDAPAAGSDRFSTQSGLVFRAGLMLNFNLMHFNRPADGTPAFADWLSTKGCGGMKYGFNSVGDVEEE